MKKIAIVGTHGVGKTTLCKALAEYAKAQGKKTECVSEVARDCPYPINQGMCYKAAEWITMTQVWREREAERQSPDLLVCDRSFFDPMIYMDVTKKDFDENEMNLFRGLRAFASNFLYAYDFVYFVQPSKRPIDPDGFRDTNKKFQESIHSWFSEEINDAMETYCITMEELCLEARYDKVININADEIFDDTKACVQRMYKRCFG